MSDGPTDQPTVVTCDRDRDSDCDYGCGLWVSDDSAPRRVGVG